jgi:hypothetical protein
VAGRGSRVLVRRTADARTGVAPAIIASNHSQGCKAWLHSVCARGTRGDDVLKRWAPWRPALCLQIGVSTGAN